MRHSASLLVSLEGLSRPAYYIARELSNNSRSGLTVRFLSKKLDLPEEEVEYLIDMNPRLIFTDLTKVKLVAEGFSAIRRIGEGLENHGDVPSMLRSIKGLDVHEFRAFEELLGVDSAATKKVAAEEHLERNYKHPDSVVAFVATRNFSELARNLFDIVWQNTEGVMPVSQLRAAQDGAEFEIEKALLELFRGFALFEMFRFDVEERLVRVVGLLSEIRQHRESAARQTGKKLKLKAAKVKPDFIESRGLQLSDTVCRLLAALAARPARLRGDGDLFREDRRRLGEICDEEGDPSLSTCLWIAEGVGWMARVDESLCAGELETLLGLDRIQRHRVLYDWLVSRGDEASSRRLLAEMLEEIKVGQWYSALEFIRVAAQLTAGQELPALRPTGAHWQYLSPAASGQAEQRFARSIESTLFWLGIVDRGAIGNESFVRATELGEILLRNQENGRLQALFPPRKGELIVQPNFDIVVPTQDMDPLLTAPLDQFAVRQSTGQATVYNLSKESFIQAVQEGHDAAGFVNFLIRHNRGETLPANVMMTLEDWRGTMKRVRMRTVHLLESEDPLIMADLVHRRRYNKHFKTLDPLQSVAFSGISKADLRKALEKDGFVIE
ncbi:MAG: helicase-associated domain-containing protein [Candidatus Hydrogenedentes bacterium]|nr:helicase-associated domain-containing protein [Candidatus Hydrogenedentota bacterium]